MSDILDLLDSVDLDTAREILSWVRIRRPNTVAWPADVAHVYADMEADEAERRMRKHYWEDPRPFAVVYRGEVLNMRRPAGYLDEHRDDLPHIPAEVHVRATVVEAPTDSAGSPDRYLAFIGHVEPSRFEAMDAHVSSEYVLWYSQGELGWVLDECGIETYDTGWEP